MRNGVGMGLACDVDQTLGDQRACNRGTQQILALVHRVGAKHREHEVTHEFFAQVVDENIAGLDAHLDGFGACGCDFFALTDIGGEGHHFAVIHILQPLQDDRGIQPAGISEHDFFYFLIHDKKLNKNK